MKKITFCLMTTCLLLTFHPQQSNAANAVKSSSVTVSKVNESTKVSEKLLLLRLNEINVMNKSNLKSSDKQMLRKEVIAIGRQLKTYGGGVIYISGGALLVIIILLILLL